VGILLSYLASVFVLPLAVVMLLLNLSIELNLLLMLSIIEDLFSIELPINEFD